MANNQYIFTLSRDVERKHVFYKNRFGITIAADLYTPKDMGTGTKLPGVVIGPPYSGVKEQGPGVYANQLAQNGYAALAFDPSYNGESCGEPRHVSSPDIFTEDFMAGVDYLGTREFRGQGEDCGHWYLRERLFCTGSGLCGCQDQGSRNSVDGGHQRKRGYFLSGRGEEGTPESPGPEAL